MQLPGQWARSWNKVRGQVRRETPLVTSFRCLGGSELGANLCMSLSLHLEQLPFPGWLCLTFQVPAKMSSPWTGPL